MSSALARSPDKRHTMATKAAAIAPASAAADPPPVVLSAGSSNFRIVTWYSSTGAFLAVSAIPCPSRHAIP
jgi:hypothetical protein